AAAIGAQAYAKGSRVAFRSSPDLHTAAHEAAHVVQQQAGVHLKGGVGEAGDRHEQHADAVADAVVAGRSAAPLLAEYSHRSGTGRATAVQGKAEAVQLLGDRLDVEVKPENKPPASIDYYYQDEHSGEWSNTPKEGELREYNYSTGKTETVQR